MVCMDTSETLSSPSTDSISMTTSTLIDNLYVVQNGNGTVDTMMCRDIRMGAALAGAVGGTRGGVRDVAQISVLEDLDLDSQELRFNYRTSMN